MLFVTIFSFVVPASIDHSNLENEVLGNLNQSTTLLCPASGVPLPSIAWLRDNYFIQRSDSRYQILEGKIHCQNP